VWKGKGVKKNRSGVLDVLGMNIIVLYVA